MRNMSNKLIVYDISTKQFIENDSYYSLDPGDTRVEYVNNRAEKVIECLEFVGGYGYRDVDLMLVDTRPAGWFSV